MRSTSWARSWRMPDARAELRARGVQASDVDVQPRVSFVTFSDPTPTHRRSIRCSRGPRTSASHVEKARSAA